MEGKHGALASASPGVDLSEGPSMPRVAPGRSRPGPRRSALISLLRSRLRETRGGRLSALFGLILVAVFGVVELILRADEGPRVPFGGPLETAARAVAWAVGVPIALAAAQDRARLDREAGIEALVATRGGQRGTPEAVRAFASMLQATRAIGLPILVLSLLAVALAGSLSSAIR